MNTTKVKALHKELNENINATIKTAIDLLNEMGQRPNQIAILGTICTETNDKLTKMRGFKND